MPGYYANKPDDDADDVDLDVDEEEGEESEQQNNPGCLRVGFFILLWVIGLVAFCWVGDVEKRIKCLEDRLEVIEFHAEHPNTDKVTPEMLGAGSR